MAAIDEIRKAGSHSNWYIIIDAPPTVYSARVNGAINATTWTIPFDGGSGTLTNCLEDMTLLIGTAAGLSDKGQVRLRKTAAGGDTTFSIGADPSLDIDDDDYLTVIDDFAPFAKHPVGVNLDVDWTYSDEFTNCLPVPWFGGRIRVIEAGGTVSYNAVLSWCPGSSITGYAWTFTGATSTTDTDTATPTATYETSGRYRVALTVTAANGKSYTGYGYVYVRGSGLIPEPDFICDRVECTVGDGARARVTMLDRPTIKDNARAIIFSDDWHGAVKGSYGVVPGMENILIDGRILDETIARSPGKNRVEFEIGGSIGVWNGIASLPAGLINTAFPSEGASALPAWSKMASLTVYRGLHYLAIYRSTIARTTDIWAEDYGWAVPQLSATGDSLGSQLSDYAGHAALGLFSNAAGQMFLIRDTQLYPLASRSGIATVAALVDADWQNEASIVRRQHGDLAVAQAQGQVFAGGVLVKIGARSPGVEPARWGGSNELSDLYVSTQAEISELAGLLAGSQNTVIESIALTLANNNRLMDVAPRMYVSFAVDGVTYKCLPRRVTFARKASTGFCHTEIELEPEGGQWPAVKLTYPEVDDPPIDDPDPPLPPPPPEPPEPPEPPFNPGDANAVVAVSLDVRTTATLVDVNPTWVTEMNPTCPQNQIVDLDRYCFNTGEFYAIEPQYIWKATTVGGGTAVWERLWTNSQFPAELGDSLTLQLDRIKCAYTVPGLMFVLARVQKSGIWYSVCGRSLNRGVLWSWFTIGVAPTLPKQFSLGSVQGAVQYFSDLAVSGSAISVSLQTSCSGGGNWQYTARNVELVLDSPIEGNTPLAISWQCTGTMPSLDYDTDQDQPPFIEYRTFNPPVVASSYGKVGDVWSFNGTLYPDRLTDRSLLHLGWFTDRTGRWANMTDQRFDITVFNIRIGGDPYGSGGVGRAFDTAKTNSGYIYYGNLETVWRSTNGGVNWTQLTAVPGGAYDIAIDPWRAGVANIICTDGNIYLLVDTTINATLGTDIPCGIPLRLGVDPETGDLYHLMGGMTFRRRHLGTWTDVMEDFFAATGLHAYKFGKIICVDSGNIYTSDDYGVSLELKKGDWTAFASGVNSHRMGNGY